MQQDQVLNLILDKLGDIDDSLDALKLGQQRLEERISNLEKGQNKLEKNMANLDKKIDKLLEETEFISITVKKSNDYFRSHTHNIGEAKLAQ